MFNTIDKLARSNINSKV